MPRKSMRSRRPGWACRGGGDCCGEGDLGAIAGGGFVVEGDLDQAAGSAARLLIGHQDRADVAADGSGLWWSPTLG